MKPYEINNKSVLIVPDSHERIKWVRAIIEKEKGNYEHIVFLGDEIDSFDSPPIVSTTEEICEFIREVIDNKYGDYTLIWANHTIDYYEASFYFNKGEIPTRLFTFCSGYSHQKAAIIARLLKQEHWNKFDLFKLVNGWLISHAGLHRSFWNDNRTKEQNLDDLYEYGLESIKGLPFKSTPLIEAGYGRGGHNRYPGITWCDFKREFESIKEIKQIFGHTILKTPQRKGFRDRDDSWCLDTNQNHYALLSKDGYLTIKKFPHREVK